MPTQGTLGGAGQENGVGSNGYNGRRKRKTRNKSKIVILSFFIIKIFFNDFVVTNSKSPCKKPPRKYVWIACLHFSS